VKRIVVREKSFAFAGCVCNRGAFFGLKARPHNRGKDSPKPSPYWTTGLSTQRQEQLPLTSKYTRSCPSRCEIGSVICDATRMSLGCPSRYFEVARRLDSDPRLYHSCRFFKVAKESNALRRSTYLGAKKLLSRRKPLG
jgi:hypothetical protein